LPANCEAAARRAIAPRNADVVTDRARPMLRLRTRAQVGSSMS
jgi:hypothetical protein